MDPIQFSKDFTCTHREYLPCKFAYPDGNIYRCSYHRLWVLANWINGDEEKANELTNQACEPIRDEKRISKDLARLHKSYAKDVIKNSQIGDVIFCFDELDGEVILLDKPQKDSEHCVYENKRGEIKSKSVMLFRTISKGNYQVKHLIKGKNSEIKAQMIKRMANEAGFRVEIKNVKEGFLVKLFGDSQKEVDDFMSLCVYHDFTLI
jgi:hypothetical protein